METENARDDFKPEMIIMYGEIKVSECEMEIFIEYDKLVSKFSNKKTKKRRK